MEKNARNTERRFWIYDATKFIIREVYVSKYSSDSKHALVYKHIPQELNKDGRVEFTESFVPMSRLNTNDLYLTREAAENSCAIRIREKIYSLKRQINRLEKVLAGNSVNDKERK